MSRATQRKMMLFGKSFSDLSQLMPAQSSEPPSAGTIAELPTAQTVIGSDTPPTPPPVEPQSKRLTKEQVNCLPYFTVFNMSCCGYMDVSGIQDALYKDRSVEEILLGLGMTFRRQHKGWVDTQHKIDAIYAEMNRLRRTEGVDNWRDQYIQLNEKSVQLDTARTAQHHKIKAAGAFLFTFISDYRSTDFTNKLTEFAKRHDLGTVTEVPEFYNPNSSNMVISVILGLEQGAFNDFVKERLPPEE